MINWLVVFGLAGPFGPFSQASTECFELVKRFDPSKSRGTISDRDRIEKALTERPEALWAVFWGSHHRNADVSARCTWILHVWKTRRDENHYRAIVQSADGDFDRFLNSFLHSPAPNLELFAEAAHAGRTFNQYFVKKSFRSMKVLDTKPARTPFHDFAEYLEIATPRVSHAPPQHHADGEYRPYLAWCDTVKSDRLALSIVISQGNLDLGRGTVSILFCGGDAVFDRLIATIVFAAGDVTIRRGDRVMVIAGGKVTVTDFTTDAFILTPKKVEVPKFVNQGNPLGSTSLILDGKPKPAPDLFAFRDLWTDYGLDAVMEQTRPKIAKIRPESDFSNLFKEGDVLASIGKKKIESLGQFRRLLRLALDTGEFNFDIERDGKRMTVRADLKSKQP